MKNELQPDIKTKLSASLSPMGFMRQCQHTDKHNEL